MSLWRQIHFNTVFLIIFLQYQVFMAKPKTENTVLKYIWRQNDTHGVSSAKTKLKKHKNICIVITLKGGKVTIFY